MIVTEKTYGIKQIDCINYNVMEVALEQHPNCTPTINNRPILNSTTFIDRNVWKIDLNAFKLWNYNELTKEIIAEGFFGVVSKVTHPLAEEVMVLKELKKTPKNEAKNRTMFEEEIRLISTLHHPNLLEFRGIAIHNGNVCLLSEFIDGGSLEQNLTDKSKLLSSWDVCLEIALDVARGMTYLHSKGIIHRDLASRNILLKCRPGGYKGVVADLGLCCTLPDVVFDSSTGENYLFGIVGSPFHMAPEVIKSKPYNQKADVFSYGIILCEVISGCPGGDPDDVPRTDDYGLAVEEFSHRVVHCPVEFLNVSVQCCQLNPLQRPAFVDLAKALDIILDQWHENQENRSQVSSPDIKTDYLIEESTNCTCDESSRVEEAFIPDLRIRECVDRFGTPQRTGSRRLLRKLVGRCSKCGGRVLPWSMVKDSPKLSISRQTIDNNDDGIDAKLDSKNSSVVINGNVIKDILPSSFKPANLLKQNPEEMNERTSSLAQNTPGKLPRFFQYIIKTRRSKYRVKNHAKSPRKRNTIAATSASPLSCTESSAVLSGEKEKDNSVILRRQVNRALSEPPEIDFNELTMEQRRYSMPLRTESKTRNEAVLRKSSDNSPAHRPHERKQRSHSFFNILAKMRTSKK